jgi:DNA-binding response OmpR family regulator
MALGKKTEKWDGAERRAPARVLVVNDDPDAGELLVRILAQAGYRSSAVSADREVMQAVYEQLPRCVVLDMSGVGSSLKVLDTIRSSDDRRIATTRILLCAPSLQNRSFSFQSGADDFLLRPFHAGELLDMVADVLARPESDRSRHRKAQLTST